MNALCRFLLAAGLLANAAFFLNAAETTWNGMISDKTCGAHHAQMINTKYPDLQTSSASPSGDCTLRCVKGGAKYVFVTGDKVYDIANQDFAALQDKTNASVEVTGELKGNTITVSKISKK